MKFSGAEILRDRNPGVYQRIAGLEKIDLEKGYVASTNKILSFVFEIERDLLRTFPENEKFIPCPGTQSFRSSETSRNEFSARASYVSGGTSYTPPIKSFCMLTEKNPYLVSLRRILSTFAYYSWPHPDPSQPPHRRCSYDIGY
jgi:hypothetical protein